MHSITAIIPAYNEEKTVAEVIKIDITRYGKEEKFGLVKGFSERVKMYWDVIKTFGLMTR